MSPLSQIPICWLPWNFPIWGSRRNGIWTKGDITGLLQTCSRHHGPVGVVEFGLNSIKPGALNKNQSVYVFVCKSLLVICEQRLKWIHLWMTSVVLRLSSAMHLHSWTTSSATVIATSRPTRAASSKPVPRCRDTLACGVTAAKRWSDSAAVCLCVYDFCKRAYAILSRVPCALSADNQLKLFL